MQNYALSILKIKMKFDWATGGGGAKRIPHFSISIFKINIKITIYLLISIQIAFKFHIVLKNFQQSYEIMYSKRKKLILKLSLQ